MNVFLTLQSLRANYLQVLNGGKLQSIWKGEFSPPLFAYETLWAPVKEKEKEKEKRKTERKSNRKKVQVWSRPNLKVDAAVPRRRLPPDRLSFLLGGEHIAPVDGG